MTESTYSLARRAPPGCELPVLLAPSAPGEPLASAFARLRPDIESHLRRVGGVLLRGFDVPAVQDFRDFAAGFGDPLLSYEFASTPRSAVQAGLDRRAYRHARRLLVASESLADQLTAQGIPPDRLRVVPPGRDVAASPGAPPGDLRRGRQVAELQLSKETAGGFRHRFIQ